MRTFYKSIAILFSSAILNQSAKCQLINENFNAGIPPTYTQSPIASWSLSANLGTSGTGCAFTQELNTTTVTASLRSPALNLNSVTNVTVTFQAAVVGNNFIVPNVALSYDAGSGIQFIARWGSGFSPNTTYTINSSYDYTPPLDAQYVNWFTCTQTLSAISSNSVSFIFDGELINGGYVLIDDIRIMGQPVVTTGVVKNEQNDFITIFPNPVTDKKVRIEGGNIKKVLLFDNLGRNLPVDFAKSGDTIEVNLEVVKNGIYYLETHSIDDILIYKKIVIE